MLRFLSRFVGYWMMAGGLVAAVVDGARSITASMILMTPLRETLEMIAAAGGDVFAAPEAPWPLDKAIAWVLTAPTAAVLAALGFLFLAAGRKRRRPLFGSEFAT
jgi:hypothetical protein